MSYQGRDYARFYDLDENTSYPSVTTILDVINKPALGPWYAKVERQAILAAVGDALSNRTKPKTRKEMLALIEELAKEKKAADRQKERAADIGNQAHAMVEWTLRKRLGLKVNGKPDLSKEAANCFRSWQAWFKSTGLTPVAAEKMVYCHACGIAGTADLVAEKKGKIYILDWKTGKAIYEESFLQNIAYQHCYSHMAGKRTAGGAVVRLPKEGGGVEVQMTPKTVKYESFQAAHALWKWTREIKGLKTGDIPKEKH